MEQGQEIVRVEHGQRALITREQLAAEVEQRRLLGEYVKSCMVPGEDYGIIPGTKKPTLLKPGAEKLLALFHCSPVFELLQKTEDFERGFFAYMFRVQIVAPRGGVLAEGYGSANSMESRYRWRDGKRKCPSCGSDAALLKSKKEGDGFFCWAKKGGCGATFKEDDKRITEQQVGRVENPDKADLANTILKMAKKRAQVDGAIALARCSDMFTQDLEDSAQPEEHRTQEPPRQEHQNQGHHPGEPSAEVPHSSRPPATVTFGPVKGKPILEMSNEELVRSIDLAHTKLMEQPKAKWAKAMRENLAALEAEQERRVRLVGAATGKPFQLSSEEAEKRDLSKEMVGFGQWKGRMIGEMSVEEIQECAEFLQERLKSPEPMHGASVAQNTLLLLGVALDRKMAKAGVSGIV